MKGIFFGFLIIILSVFSACSRFEETTVTANEQYSKNKNASTNALQISPIAKPSVEISKKNFNIDSKSFYAWVGGVSFHNETLASDWIWSNENLGKILDGELPETQIEVDILNCAGYLGSGNISYKTKIEGVVPEWEISVDKETVAKDVVEKLKKCETNPDEKGEYVSGNAFAVAPRNDNRRNTKVGEVNTKNLFTSLPKDTREWLNNKYGATIRKKDDLSLINDNWTDTDGDGKIDLLYAFTNYDVEHSSGVIMLLVNGKWKDIGNVRD